MQLRQLQRQLQRQRQPLRHQRSSMRSICTSIPAPALSNIDSVRHPPAQPRRQLGDTSSSANSAPGFRRQLQHEPPLRFSVCGRAVGVRAQGRKNTATPRRGRCVTTSPKKELVKIDGRLRGAALASATAPHAISVRQQLMLVRPSFSDSCYTALCSSTSSLCFSDSDARCALTEKPSAQQRYGNASIFSFCFSFSNSDISCSERIRMRQQPAWSWGRQLVRFQQQ